MLLRSFILKLNKKMIMNLIIFLFVCSSITLVCCEDCSKLTNFMANSKLYTFNTSESVFIIPIHFENIITDWGGVGCSSGNCSTFNEILYENNMIPSLSNTKLKINDKVLTEAIYNLLSSDAGPNNVIRVLSNRYIYKSPTENNNYLVYSISYGTFIPIINNLGCSTTKFRYRSKISKIKGLICVNSYVSGVRFSLTCDEIKLHLNAINDNGMLDSETKCE